MHRTRLLVRERIVSGTGGRLAGAFALLTLVGQQAQAAQPVVTVDIVSTYSSKPRLTGAVSDPTATIQVTVQGNNYAGVNNADGTWTLAGNLISPALPPGTYNVGVLASTVSNGSGTDGTTNELTIIAGKGAVQAAFDNPLTGPAANPPQNGSSATFFGGCGNQAWPAPASVCDNGSSGTVRLQSAAFGQAFGSQLPSENFVVATVNNDRCRLYPSRDPAVVAACAAVVPGWTVDSAAFRYRYYMYSANAASEIIRSASGINQYWTAGDQGGAAAVAQDIKDAVRLAPTAQNLRWVLLDVLYDTASANLAVAREKAQQVAKIRLGLLVPPGAGPFVVDSEITYLKDSLPLYDAALQGYMDLLKDPLGIDPADVADPLDPSLSTSTQATYPAGYLLFRQEVPQRSPTSEFYGTSGSFTLTPTTPGQEAYTPFAGYKDLVLILDAMRDQVRTMQDLAWLYIIRGNPATQTELSDATKAADLIKTGLASRYLEINAVLNVFRGKPGFSTTGANGSFGTAASGAQESLASVRSALTGLQGLGTFLAGTTNPLGFADDFLLLSQPNTSGCTGNQPCDTANSYNYWANFVSTGPLADAVTKYDIAHTAYPNYQDRLDNLATQFQAKQQDFNARLLQVEGSNPATPFDNVGSELWQAKQDEQLAALHIQQNGVEIENLEKEIQIEADRAASEGGHYGQMQQIVIKYGNKQAELTQQISYIKAAQAAANSIGNSKNIYFGVVNAVLQAASESAIGTLQAHKEQLAAEEQATLLDQQGQILQDNSKARIATLMLRMRTLAIDSLENAILAQKAFGRTTALVIERDDLYRRRDENNTTLATRYFADPSHRLLADNSIIQADQAFREAQKWVFITLRALEYKRNSPFQYTTAGLVTYTPQTVFKVRNAPELQNLMGAMSSFNTLSSSGTLLEDFDYPFSIKKTFLGYVPVGVDQTRPISGTNPEAAAYVDPVSGALVKADQAWKSYLLKHLKPWDPSDSPTGACQYPGAQVLRLDFDTAFNPKLSGFFDPNRYLEKIDLIRISVDVPTPIAPVNKPACLTYGGTARIRNQSRGVVSDPAHPDRLTGETRDYVSRHYLYSTRNARIESVDSLDASISILTDNIPPNSPAPPSSYNVDVLRERSIATTHWSLIIPYLASGTRTINIEDARDVTLWFYWHYYAPRL